MFPGDSLAPAMSTALCMLLGAIKTSPRVHTLRLMLYHTTKDQQQLRSLLMHVLAACSQCLLRSTSLQYGPLLQQGPQEDVHTAGTATGFMRVLGLGTGASCASSQHVCDRGCCSDAAQCT